MEKAGLVEEHSEPVVIVAGRADGFAKREGPDAQSFPSLGDRRTPCEEMLGTGIAMAAQAAWAEVVWERGKGHVAEVIARSEG